jgi:hypothetical protein
MNLQERQKGFSTVSRCQPETGSHSTLVFEARCCSIGKAISTTTRSTSHRVTGGSGCDARRLQTPLEEAESEPGQGGDPEEVKGAVEQLSRYLAESRCRRDGLLRVGGTSLADPFQRARIRTLCQSDRELCLLRGVRATDSGNRGKESSHPKNLTGGTHG